MTIQTIIDKFKSKIPSIVGAGSKVLIIEAFKDSLTSMLDSVEEDIGIKMIDLSLMSKYNEGYNHGNNQHHQKVINIINSHR